VKKKGTHNKLLSSLPSEKLVGMRVNGEVRELSDFIELVKNYTHNIEVVINRLFKKNRIEKHLTDYLTT